MTFRNTPLWVSLVCLVLLEYAQAQFFLFNGTDSIDPDQPLSSACSNALAANITCPDFLLGYVGLNSFLSSDTTTSLICDLDCTNSIKDYHYDVAAACANDMQPWAGIPATYWGDVVWGYTNRTCLKDPGTGDYCSGKRTASR
jgi:hypothetical protein